MNLSLSKLHRDLKARRRLRGPTGLKIALSDSIRLLDAGQWDSLVAGGSWFFSRDYLAMLESVPPEVLEPRYALVADEDGPVAAVVMQWAAIEGTDLQPIPNPAKDADDDVSPLRKLMGGIAKRGAQLVSKRIHERVLVCGNLLSYGQHAVMAAPDADPETVWAAVAEVLYRVRRAEKLSGQAGFVLIKDIPEDAVASVSLLKGLGYRSVETEPNMALVLDPAWKTHEYYLASMTSKYRSAVKNRVIEPLRKAGLEVRHFEATPEMGPRLHDLYLQVHHNAALRPFTLHPEYFPALARAAGEKARFHGIFEADRLLGFIVTLLDGAQAIGYHIGFDREAAKSHPLYLRLLHAGIADGIAMGAREISFGRTALEPKSRLGATPQPMQVWVRHRHPAFNQVVQRLLFLARHDEAPEHNPFKQAKPDKSGDVL